MNIKNIRNQLMLTQGEFARLIGVSLQTVSNWECGRAEPTMKLKREISKLCHLKNIKTQ